MAEHHAQNKARLISETRRRFEAEYVTDKSDKYDPRDVERLQQDDNWIESYLAPKLQLLIKVYHFLDLTESSIPRWLLEIGGIYLHGYDKEATGDMEFVRFIINCFKVYYPKYLSKMVIFDMPWIMNAAFKIVKTWLGPEAVSLLKFASKSDIQDYVSVEYLPPHMGGTDPFKYSYPPLVDDDFQTPLCENGPIASEDEASSKEDIESDGKEILEAISNEEQTALLKKINLTEPTSKAEEHEKDSKMKAFKKPLSVFKGPLLHISPAEELYFGNTESGEKKTLIVLTNVTKNIVAFKVRTTAPEKYRVKPSNSSCDPGASVDIVVSPHGGLTVSAQDRFLIMAAEMEQSSGTGPAELTQFWKEVPRNKVMEHRLRCHIVESSKPTTLTLKDNAFNISDKTGADIYLQFANSSRESDCSPP
nr:motile sperm domain-containing protein 2 [Equus asinus]